MFPNFLPSNVTQLSEKTSIELAASLQQAPVTIPSSSKPIQTCFVQQGENNTPILLLHGFDSSIMEFRRLLPKLANRRETWAIDLLGFGFTGRLVDLTYNTDNIKAHLKAFWEKMINRPVVLAGVSMGGATAIDFALTYPDIVESLVLIDSAGLAKPPSLKNIMFPPLDRLATLFLANAWVRKSVSRNAYYDKTFVNEDSLICTSLHLPCPFWSEALISFTKNGGYASFTEKLPRLSQPTLILWGDCDQILGTKDAEKFQDLVPNSKLVWLEDCGHIPHLEKPKETADHIIDFLEFA